MWQQRQREVSVKDKCEDADFEDWRRDNEKGIQAACKDLENAKELIAPNQSLQKECHRANNLIFSSMEPISDVSAPEL